MFKLLASHKKKMKKCIWLTLEWYQIFFFIRFHYRLAKALFSSKKFYKIF